MCLPPNPPPDPLLTVRTAVVLTLGLIIGLAAGALGYLAQRDVPTALLIAGGATGGALALFHSLLGR
jgi:hypothetical protein